MLFSTCQARLRLWLLIGLIHLALASGALAETSFESRYQYYQEEHDRIRVDSNYSLFSLDLNDTTSVAGTFLYSAISGASPSGLPPLVQGQPVPVVGLTDERFAYTIGVNKQLGRHALSAGFAYSTESDYWSHAYSLQDIISLNQKNTELTLGFSFANDRVGENGTDLNAPKRSYDAIVGVTQILGPDDLLSLNLSLGWRQGFLSDPYKRVLLNQFFVLPDTRPNRRFEQLVFLQWTHHLPWEGASVETSYRFGHNDFGSHSHTAQVAFYQKFFDGRLVFRPGFRYYWQSAADFYDTEFFGNPRYFSADYRLSEEETFSLNVQLRWYAVKDRFAVDLGYERYATQGLDGKTPQSAYPDANSFTVGLHYQY